MLRRFASDVASTSTAGRSMDKMRYRPVIGLEVHVQLNTRTKLFSRTLNTEGSPNRLVTPLDMATPGILPALNKQCVMHALKMGMLLKCEIPKKSRFDRKHYFYADMPAGYQITQNQRPIAKNGRFGFYVFDDSIEPYWKEAQIVQLQLEQDSGKTIHVDKKSLIDYNRAGCALVEVVTSPCFSTALEAICFVQQLRLVLMNYGICDGELHKGHMRVDANVSLSFDGTTGTRTEIKNMNSIRSIHTAINYEIARQFDILSNGGEVLNETRAADSEGRTVSMRDKEVETDYRFMVEPNLPTLVIRDEWLNTCKKYLETTPKPKFEILRDDFGFDARSSIHISEDAQLLKFVENCVDFAKKSDFDLNSSIILGWMRELKTIMQRSKSIYPPQSIFFIQQFVDLIKFYENDRLTRLRMLDLLRVYACSEEVRNVEQVINDNDYWKICDESEMLKIVEEVLNNPTNEKLVEKFKNGHAKSFNKLRNSIVDFSNKRVEVENVERILKEKVN